MAKSELFDQEIRQYSSTLMTCKSKLFLAIARNFAIKQQDWWEEIHHDQRNAIDRSLAEMKAGKLTPQREI